MPGKLFALGGCFSECERQAGAAVFGGSFSESGRRERVLGEFHMEGIVVREETARRDLRGYCVWEKSGNGSEMLL